MPTLPAEYITILGAFASLFSQRIWEHAKILFMGAILCPAERTVTAVLRMMGLSWEKHFQNYHRVLNRAVWSSLDASWRLPSATTKGKVRKHKKLTLWARQMVVQARRWLPKRLLAVVADSSFAVMDLLWQLRQLKNPICMITRLPLDAAWYEPAPALPAKRGRPPKTNILVGSD
jgi:hypothetical protein